MRPIIRMFVLAAVSASATAAFAFDRATVNVPFNFETHGKTLQAGTYRVESAVTIALLRFPAMPTPKCPLRGSLLLQTLAIICQRPH